MRKDERELIDRLRAGDMKALEGLYRRYVDTVWRYGWFRTRDRDEAAEIVQETFLRAARRINQFEGRSQFVTWLMAIARSVLSERFRKASSRREQAADPETLRLVPAPQEPPIDMGDQKQVVRDAISSLESTQYDAVVLVDLAGLSYREAAEVMDCPESTLKSTLFRARRNLRQTLEKWSRTG